MRLRYFPLLAAAFLTGCGPTFVPYKPDASTYSDHQLLDTYSGILEQERGGGAHEPEWAREVKAEVTKRKFNIRPSRMADIRRGQVSIGMTKDEVLASWGGPSDVNKTITGSDSHEQWCFGSGASKLQFVYFRGGKVYAIQG